MPVHTHSTKHSATPSRPSHCACAQPASCASDHAATTAMVSGSTITSRESHEVRHIATARQARSGWPR